MKYFPLTTQTLNENELKIEYKSSREIGVVRLGEKHLYFRKLRKIYYIPYGDIEKCFRRVITVPMKLCCGKGDMGIEHLVICGRDGELAQIELPGTKAARILMEQLKDRIPDREV